MQQTTNGLRGRPLVGMVPEIMQNYHRIHDWLLSQFEKHPTFTAVMLVGQECYFTADVDNVKHILKTNFDNYIKVGRRNWFYTIPSM